MQSQFVKCSLYFHSQESHPGKHPGTSLAPLPVSPPEPTEDRVLATGSAGPSPSLSALTNSAKRPSASRIKETLHCFEHKKNELQNNREPDASLLFLLCLGGKERKEVVTGKAIRNWISWNWKSHSWDWLWGIVIPFL